MFSKLVILLPLLISVVGSQDTNFIYNGFRSVNLSLHGRATISSNGLLELTNDTKQQKGHTFYPTPISFKNSLNDSAFSFSTTFVFAISSGYPTLRGNGIAFVISPTRGRCKVVIYNYTFCWLLFHAKFDCNYIQSVVPCIYCEISL